MNTVRNTECATEDLPALRALPGPELVFGLIGAVGTDLADVSRTLSQQLEPRRGAIIKDATLYSTTFPCHLCARHIVAAGIRRVAYIEPYPKSVAEELYGDSLTVDAEERSTKKVAFEPFVGISPSLYPQVFRSLPSARKDSRGNVKVWQPTHAEPRLKSFVAAYVLIEDQVLGSVLPAHFARMGIQPIVSQSAQGSGRK